MIQEGVAKHFVLPRFTASVIGTLREVISNDTTTRDKISLNELGSTIVRGPIDKFSTVLGQNPTFASTWQKKYESKEGRESPERQLTLPPRVRFSSPNHQYHPIIILPLRCRNSLSTICRLYNQAIQPQGSIRSACGCIP